MITPCELCGKPVPNYEPVFCCNGFECGCHGQPMEPCVCSRECEVAIYSHTGKSIDERRRLAGIEKWKE